MVEDEHKIELLKDVIVVSGKDDKNFWGLCLVAFQPISSQPAHNLSKERSNDLVRSQSFGVLFANGQKKAIPETDQLDTNCFAED
ncbi:hypothetical protein Ancab_007459 [Ancistrocladus abbreviatus]